MAELLDRLDRFEQGADKLEGHESAPRPSGGYPVCFVHCYGRGEGPIGLDPFWYQDLSNSDGSNK